MSSSQVDDEFYGSMYMVTSMTLDLRFYGFTIVRLKLLDYSLGLRILTISISFLNLSSLIDDS